MAKVTDTCKIPKLLSVLTAKIGLLSFPLTYVLFTLPAWGTSLSYFYDINLLLHNRSFHPWLTLAPITVYPTHTEEIRN